MERRTLLTKEELQKVIELREIGSSWVKIQRETGVNRKTAKNAYEDWERRQSKEKLKQARVQVGTAIFREHMESIIRIAEALFDNLPQSMVFFETRDSETVLEQIWMRDIVGYIVRTGESWERLVGIVPFEQLPERQKQRIIRRNQMLFQCLKEHSQTIRWQEVLKSWRFAWDECLGILTELHSKAEKMVRREVENMEKGNQVEKSISNMAKGVVEAIWLRTLDGEPEKSSDLVRTKVDHVEFGGETQVLLEDKNLAGEVSEACKRVINNLCKEKTLGELFKDGNPVRAKEKGLKAAIEQLERELDPFVLRQIILKTECSLCLV